MSKETLFLCATDSSRGVSNRVFPEVQYHLINMVLGMLKSGFITASQVLSTGFVHYLLSDACFSCSWNDVDAVPDLRSPAEDLRLVHHFVQAYAMHLVCVLATLPEKSNIDYIRMLFVRWTRVV